MDAHAESTADDAVKAAVAGAKWNSNCDASPRTSEDAKACDISGGNIEDFNNSKVGRLPVLRGSIRKGAVRSM